MFKTLKDAQAWIESIYRFSDKYDLTRMEQACELLGNPQNTFKSIHIGGTNAKGSTLTYLKNMLLDAGYTVGTYTSPYVVRFNERITLNGVEIDNQTLLDYINDVCQLHETYLERYNDQISFFELVTIISFLYFRDTQPDIALIEVGLGGTLDATNVITPELSIITNIGTDHLHVIGPTIEDVAKNKLGIVKKQVPLVTGYDQESLTELFQSVTEQHDSEMIRFSLSMIDAIELGMPSRFTYDQEPYELTMVGLHQVQNAGLALLAADVLNELGYHIPIESRKHGLKMAFWPGRFEIFGNIIIDGAHNIEGLKSCFDTVLKYYPDKKIKSLFTVMADKDYQPMLALLAQHTDAIVFTEIPYQRCAKAEQLANSIDHKDVFAISDFKQALNHAKPQNEDEILVVTGSLYFISEVRKLLVDSA